MCGCAACPAGLARVFPAMKGLLFETLGLESNKGFRSGFSLPSAPSAPLAQSPTWVGGRAGPTCLVLYSVQSCGEKERRGMKPAAPGGNLPFLTPHPNPIPNPRQKNSLFPARSISHPELLSLCVTYQD